MQHHYDILVVGAGPAGSTAAFEAAKNNAKVLLIDKKKILGEPIQCAEYIPKLLLNEIKISQSCIAQKITGMKTFLQNGECIETRSPGFMLNRDIFDKELAIKAVDNGVDLCVNTVCVSKSDNKILINRDGKKEIIIPKVVIGADGPHSTVGRWIKSSNNEFVIGLQYRVPLVSSMDFTEVYFNQDFFGGYGWFFPKGGFANVGVGIKQGVESGANNLLNNLLNGFVTFLEKNGKVENTPDLKTGGLIPVGGPLITVKDNIMLVGDAAGQTHAITGGGISQAATCGKIAGRTAVKAIDKVDISILKEYENEWQIIFGNELSRARLRRQFLESNWDHLEDIVKKCWTAFREYYEE